MIGVQLERPIMITQLGFGDALRESVDQNIKSASLIYQFLQGLIERRMSAKSIEGRSASLGSRVTRRGKVQRLSSG